MKKGSKNIQLFVSLILSISIAAACNLPQGGPPSPAAGNVDSTATLTTAPEQPAVLPTETWTPAPQDTATPEITTTPRPTVVTKATLCWAGPGPVYEVVSGLKAGEEVEILGQGSIAGWIIVKNPIYRDPCWADADDLQFDPNFNISALRIFYPPPTPTYTPVPSKTPTPTP